MNTSFLLDTLLGEFHQKLDSLKTMVPRDIAFPKAPQQIKVAIGMRRVGKTYFLYQHILKLLSQAIPKTSILYLNFEDDRLLPLGEQTLAQLVDAFYSRYPENYEKKCYLFFDEIQNVPGWATVIRRLQDTKQVEIFLTGSSAKLLSKEIATNLRGRSVAIEIWPYSFDEFMRAKNIAIDRTLYSKKTQDQLRKVFHQYLTEGGFPEITHCNQDIQQQKLQEYIDVVIYRDIIERHNIKHPTLIKYMILSMIHNVGKPFAVNKFYNDAKMRGYQIGKDLLYGYTDHIEDAYLAFFSSSHDQSFRKTQTRSKKLYAIDPGLVRATTLEYEQDLGRLFENIIYLDLKRLGYTVDYYLTSEGYEIDFVAKTPRGEKKLFQVAYNIDHPDTLAREQRALDAGMKELNLPGEIITLESYLQTGISLASTATPTTESAAP